MSFETIHHPEWCDLLPRLTVGSAACECCGEAAGLGIGIGWLFWDVPVTIPTRGGGHTP